MKCANHLEKEAVGVCNHCGKSICSDCLVQLKGENYCKECIVAKMGKEKKEERSPALAAILIFIIGGLGQIYNGQIGKGILIFFTSWLIIPWIIGIVDAYKIAKKINQGEILMKSKPGCLIAAVIALVIFFFGIVFLALLAAIAIPNLLRARLAANESSIQARLKTFSTAIEAYRAANNGNFPLNESSLTSAQVFYLHQSYDNKTVSGYTFVQDFLPNGYKIIAKPEKCGVTGSKVFTLETGGVLNSRDCKEESEAR
ncbi:MAG: NINE protein [Candidatus Omnitrophica bacterium]|nr:NINE protein [Candidatus Omnitrophota bacterium]